MKTITRLVQAGETRTHVDLDGERWRTVPTALVVELGLTVGSELTRVLARDLGRGLRRHAAVAHAERLLARSERSVAQLDVALARRGVSPVVRRALVDSLEKSGLVDEHRTARLRAESLEQRGWGNAAIDYRLESEGYEAEARLAAIEGLGDELERARVALARKPRDRVQAARFLSQRGFDPELYLSLFDHHGPMEG